jgi:hypothetical protein
LIRDHHPGTDPDWLIDIIAPLPRNVRHAQRLSTNVRHVIFDLRKAKPDALTLRLAVCDFA